jgi:hypothetical protein
MAIDITFDRGMLIAEMLNELKRREYRLNFRRDATRLYCFELNQWMTPEDFTVDESYYLQETTQPDEDRMLYAISLSRGRKGFLVDTCGVYADNISAEMIKKLKPPDDKK